MFTITQALARRFAPLALALLLTACAGEGGASTPAQPNNVNDTDVIFVQLMIPHHQQAVEMAKEADTRAADPRIKEIAEKVRTLQTSEIKLMSGWLRAWGKPTLPGGISHSKHAMPGMMSPQDLEKLRQAKGAAFDRLFLQMMIEHHEGAITMAKEEQAKGKNPEVKALAKWLGVNQTTEVGQMKQMLSG